MIVIEAIDLMETSKENVMFIKLDMAKAYDRVQWACLQKVLLAFGFGRE